MSEPLVSVVIISYNQRDYIRQAVLSAVSQSYLALEVIVADDGSTDGTDDIIMEMAKDYPDRIVPLVGGKNLGITGNSNRGLAACKGKYVALQGGDDVLLPGKIASQVTWLEESSARVLCGHDVAWIDAQGQSLCVLGSNFRPLSAGCGAASVLRHGPPFAATTVMVKRASIPTYGFDERLPYVSDWKLWLDVLKNDGEFGYVEGVLAQYRRHSANITARHSKPILYDLLRTPLFAVIDSRGRRLLDALFWYGLALRKALLRRVAPLTVGQKEQQ